MRLRADERRRRLPRGDPSLGRRPAFFRSSSVLSMQRIHAPRRPPPTPRAPRDDARHDRRQPGEVGLLGRAPVVLDGEDADRVGAIINNVEDAVAARRRRDHRAGRHGPGRRGRDRRRRLVRVTGEAPSIRRTSPGRRRGDDVSERSLCAVETTAERWRVGGEASVAGRRVSRRPTSSLGGRRARGVYVRVRVVGRDARKREDGRPRVHGLSRCGCVSRRSRRARPWRRARRAG